MTEETSLSKVITIGTKTAKGPRSLTVHQKTFGMQLRRFTLEEAAEKDAPIEGDGIEALLRNHFHRRTYPALVACTEGDLPSEHELIDVMPDSELDAWLNAVREQNSDWLPLPHETQEDQEKKDSTPEPESTSS
jgi:hypothetical protein